MNASKVFEREKKRVLDLCIRAYNWKVSRTLRLPSFGVVKGLIGYLVVGILENKMKSSIRKKIENFLNSFKRIFFLIKLNYVIYRNF